MSRLMVGSEAVMRKVANLAEQLTMTLPGVAPKRGRPATGHAMTGAERQRIFRRRHKTIETGERIGATITRLAADFGLSELEVTRELLRFALCNRNWSRTGFPSQSESKGI